MSTLTWLHLSDLHAGNPDSQWDTDRVTASLIEDLERLQREHGLRPDLIFFTGDAAFGEIDSGAQPTLKGQYELFLDFLTKVRQTFNPEVDLENVFLVPGNHDVNRRLVAPAETAWLDSQESIKPIQAAIQHADLQWQRFMERLKDYKIFLKENGFKHLLDDAKRLIYAQIRQIGNLKVGIAGYNSAWSCCRDNERRKLWMAGRWQQGILRSRLKDADFSIALTHHPPDWLVEYENPDFGRGLEQDFRFLLHGHEHSDWVLNTAQGYSVIAAGACYDGSASRRNGYNITVSFRQACMTGAEPGQYRRCPT